MQSNQLKSLLEAAFPDARIEVASPDDVHFQAIVVSDAFAGKATLARHRMVYAVLGERMGGEVHALSLRTLTPGEAGPGNRNPEPGQA
ncbi:MAG TPA: BolA/IbaG family iron-sulfur metabolism protein [Rhodanobacteraceae bacterium]|jgi:acid stress-induced BolA-like protein IbaG/YrbA|nr:BolA/IbaG family iron-sulfur metabolism protein [Rhodanobacteraceae bacterium]